MKLSPLSAIGVGYILGGAAAAGCVKYNVITNPTVLQVAKVAQVALPVLGILAVVVAWLLSRREDKATNGQPPASGEQSLAPPAGTGSSSSTATVLGASSPSASQILTAAPDNTGSGPSRAPIPAPIRTDSVSSLNSVASTASSTDGAATPPSSVTSEASVLDAPPPAPSDLPSSSQPKSGSLKERIANAKRSDKTAHALSKKKEADAAAAKLAAIAAANGFNSLDEPLDPEDITQVPNPAAPKTGRRKNTETPPNTPTTDDKKTPGAIRLDPKKVSNPVANAAAKRASAPKSLVGQTTMNAWGPPPADDTDA